MRTYPQRDFFKGKKITVMGLGLLGRGLGDIDFLAKNGADLIVTDLKSAEELKTGITKLKKYNSTSHKLRGTRNITFVLGEHRLEDFRGRDFVLRAPNAPLNSPYLAEARAHGVPVKLSTSLFAELAKGVIFVGVTGTRGKTTTTVLIYEILKEAYKKTKKNVFLGGNIRGVSSLALLLKVREGDIVVCELDSWQMQAFGEAGISPHVAVFTNLLKDHMNYYMADGVSEDVGMKRYFADKAQIFLHQTPVDYIITTRQIVDKIKSLKPKGKLAVAEKENIPTSWRLKLLGEHNRSNIACAILAARSLGVSEKVIKKVVTGFGGVEGRMQYLKTVRGIKIYNDTCATTPDATIAALEAIYPTLKKGQKIVLIWGGADKKLDMSRLVSILPARVGGSVILTGSGTEKLLSLYPELKKYPLCKTLKEALTKALEKAKKGDVVLLSPAFTSFGMFNNEYDRGDQFNALARKLR